MKILIVVLLSFQCGHSGEPPTDAPPDPASAINTQVRRGPYLDQHWGRSELTIFLKNSKIVWLSLDTQSSLHFLLIPFDDGSIQVVATQSLWVADLKGGRSKSTFTKDIFKSSDKVNAARFSVEYGIPSWVEFFQRLAGYFESNSGAFPEIKNKLPSLPIRPVSTLDNPLLMKL